SSPLASAVVSATLARVQAGSYCQKEQGESIARSERYSTLLKSSFEERAGKPSNFLELKTIPGEPIALSGKLWETGWRISSAEDSKMLSPWFGEFMGTLVLILMGDVVVGGVLLHSRNAVTSGWIVITTVGSMLVNRMVNT